jgi:Phosphoserine aminotransferase
MFDWYKKEGGIKKMEETSIEKSNKLYSLIDKSDFYINPVNKEQRSSCNVVFTLSNPKLDSTFLEDSDNEGLKYLKGHRTVGGMRASIYNSLSMDAVESLTDFMRSFETKYG